MNEIHLPFLIAIEQQAIKEIYFPIVVRAAYGGQYYRLRFCVFSWL